MSCLAIKGHVTRGKEVIEILEMLGGRNVRNYACDLTDYAYSINGQGIINWYIPHPNSPLVIYTLEEFLEKFPYKVGDKVYNIIHNENQTITNLIWDPLENEVGYQTDNNEYVYVNYLQPYKEETMKERKYADLRLDVDQDDKLATEVTIDGDKITPPENYLIGKITKVDNGVLVEFVKKQPQYPKTYEECCDIIEYPHNVVGGYKAELLSSFQNLLICRDAYWKIAGEQMGLGEPWKPDWEKADERKYCIVNTEGNVAKWVQKTTNKILTFPTEEMRDAFYENFKDLIELVKELL